MNFDEGIEFDPGFTMHLSLISRDIDNFYYNLNLYSKFQQKKQYFKTYSQKLWKLVERNIGFYSACVLWAGIAKEHPDKLILNNICSGGDYVEADNIAEVEFLKKYILQYQKDFKYYCGQDYTIPEIFTKILDDYEEFLKINEGFVHVSKAGDLKLPTGLKSINNESSLLEKVEKVVETGDFRPMIECYAKVK